MSNTQDLETIKSMLFRMEMPQFMWLVSEACEEWAELDCYPEVYRKYRKVFEELAIKYGPNRPNNA